VLQARNRGERVAADNFDRLGFQLLRLQAQIFQRLRVLLSATSIFAPRDSASRPSTPLPAKQSSTTAPGHTGASQLNSVSRIRSGVGRKPSASTTSIFRPRHLPPMILILDFRGIAIFTH